MYIRSVIDLYGKQLVQFYFDAVSILVQKFCLTKLSITQIPIFVYKKLENCLSDKEVLIDAVKINLNGRSQYNFSSYCTINFFNNFLILINL